MNNKIILSFAMTLVVATVFAAPIVQVGDALRSFVV